MAYEIERAMLDNWAGWLRRNRYQFGPRQPKCSIGAAAELGMPTGPVHYGDEAVDPDEEATRVDQFMARLKEANERAHAALVARHAREFTDARGIRWSGGMPERKMARAMYGTPEEAALRMFRRDCEAGYETLARQKVAA